MAAKKKPQQRSTDKIRADLAKRGITEQDVSDAIVWARKTETPSKGGILAMLRNSPMVGANLNLKRPRVKPRKVDL